jgi:hypothetical protein
MGITTKDGEEVELQLEVRMKWRIGGEGGGNNNTCTKCGRGLYSVM